MANSRNYRTPTGDDDADVPYWNDLLAQDVAQDVDALEGTVADVAAAAPTRKTFEGEEYLAVETDTNYRLSRGVRKDGTQHIPRLQTGHVTSSTFATDDYLKVTVDANNKIAEDALDKNGRVPGWVLEAWAKRMGTTGTAAPIASRGIICRGDSITAGAYGEGTSYPLELSRLRPELVIARRGNPGERSLGISQRQGSSPLLVTVTGGVIPASGSVAVTLNTAYMWMGTQAGQGIPEPATPTGTLNGIKGYLSGNPGAYTFTRTATGGAAYNCPPDVPFLDEWESTHRDWNQIVMTGYNNSGDTAQILDCTAKIVGFQTSGDFLVMSVTTSVANKSGTAGYTNTLNANAALKQQYPNNYFDLRGWLIANGLAAVGITPTADDTAAIAGDTIPPSLMASDGIHPNPSGYKAMAIGINQVITARGWK